MSFSRFFCCPGLGRGNGSKGEPLLKKSKHDGSAADGITRQLIDIVNGSGHLSNQLAQSTANLFNVFALEAINDMPDHIKEVDVVRFKSHIEKNKVGCGPTRAMSFSTGEDKIATQMEKNTQVDNEVYAGAGQNKAESGEDRASIFLLLVEELESKLQSYKLSITWRKIDVNDDCIIFSFSLNTARHSDGVFVGDEFPLNLVYSVIKYSDKVRLRLQKPIAHDHYLADSGEYTIPTERAQSFSNI